MLSDLLLGAALLSALALLHRWLFWDLGAERRGRRAAVAALRDVARDHPEAADFARAAAEVSSRPGD